MSVWGDDLNGADYNTKWGPEATVTRPPEGWTWSHNKIGASHGHDEVAMMYDSRAEFRTVRLAWLDQFEVEVTEEGAYRWWKWYDGERTCRWSERRPLSASLPKTPGLWPRDE